MAYATGSATTANDLLSVVRDFAQANGWTIDKTATNLLFLHKGICYAAIQAVTYNYTDYTTRVGVSTPDTRFDMALSTSFTIGLSTFYGHPGSLSTSSGDGDRAGVNNLQGPFPEYHLFTNATGDYVMCAVRTGVDTWRHFGFGLLDKGNFTHSGVAFLCGQGGYFFPNQSSATSGSMYGNDPGRADFPFCRNSNVAQLSNNSNNYYIPDATPNTADWPNMSNNALPMLNAKTRPPIDYPSGSTLPAPRLLNTMMGSVASQWGGNVMLWPIPLFMQAAAISKTCYIGDIPEVRLINMEGLQNGQELAIASDTWKIFSIGRLMPWATQAVNGLIYSTGQYGVAYRKIP